MDREKQLTDDDLARSHRSKDPVGPHDQPEGERTDTASPSGVQFDRPLTGRSGDSDEKSRGKE